MSDELPQPPPVVVYPSWLHAVAKELFVAHMRSQGYGGDNWDKLPSTTRQMWLERADKGQRAKKPSRHDIARKP